MWIRNEGVHVNDDKKMKALTSNFGMRRSLAALSPWLLPPSGCGPPASAFPSLAATTPWLAASVVAVALMPQKMQANRSEHTGKKKGSHGVMALHQCKNT